MKYILNDYLQYISDNCTRLEVSPNKEIAAKLVSEYESRDAMIVPIRQLIPHNTKNIPNPDEIIGAIYNHAKASGGLTVFVGIEPYLAFLRKGEQKDFFIGLYDLLDKQQINARFIISSKYIYVLENPKYENSMQIIYFQGVITEADALDIQLFPSKWVGQIDAAKMLIEALERLGDYIPVGEYRFAMDETEMPSSSYNHISIVTNANEALAKLYGIDANFDLEQANMLLCECADRNLSPVDVLVNRFGGEEYLNCEKAPVQLSLLKDDVMWELYVWLLKSKIKQNTYLYQVLVRTPTAKTFMEQYVVDTAISLLGDKNAEAFAGERASVLMKMGMIEPLIDKFVSQTECDDRSVVFLNCGTNVEMQGLIRRAARQNVTANLPAVFDKTAPILNFYLSPFFDYGDAMLTSYFHRLRYFRLKDCIDKSFVQEAYYANVPKEIERRDCILHDYDDGETALLMVDGMGAEYYPLLINIAKHNHLNLEQKQIVSVNLPTSTNFNTVVWSAEHRLQDVKQADNISHAGYSKYEKLILFHKKILARVVDGLRNHKRVVVTADHGSSYLAVTAYRNQLVHTIEWDNPDDWRYTSLPTSKDAPDDLIPVYHPESSRIYFVVRGYNRLSKRGNKMYGLHGGATLEERLVPFVVFTKESVQEPEGQEIEQFIEDDAFDIL